MISPLSIRCPVCRVNLMRPCRNRRGYLVPTHKLRARAFLAELAGETTTPPQPVSERGRGARGATPERVSRGVAQVPELSDDEFALF